LGSQDRPHVVVEGVDPQQTYVYQNRKWTLSHPALIVFDDQFVDDNVYSGLSVGTGHRQNLHEVILGKQGVALARQVDELADEIAGLNKSLRQAEADIPKGDVHGLDVGTFCDLPHVEDIDERVDEQSKQVDALRKAEAVRKTRFFSRLDFPSFDVDGIDNLLARQLEDLDRDAVGCVQSQFATLASDGESWTAQGTRYLESQPADRPDQCPYCGQDVQGVELVDAYRAYFGESYRSHLTSIRNAINEHTKAFGGDALAAMQQSIGQLENRYTFWKPLVTLPEVQIDASGIATAWTEARETVRIALEAKQASPLEPTSLDEASKIKIGQYDSISQQVASHSEQLVACNDAITELKQATASGDIQRASQELDRLIATKARHSEKNKAKCEAYLKAQAAKANAERRKQQAREALDTYRRQVFPQYCTAINDCLNKFGASFTIEDVKPQDTAGRPSTAYHLCLLKKKGNRSHPGEQ
jgi:wobble nucleotide-excising tRNase